MPLAPAPALLRRLLATILACAAALPARAQSGDAAELLRRTVDRLSALHSVVFEQTVELNYASEDYRQVIPSRGRLLFDPSLPLGARMHFETPSAVFACDETDCFTFDKARNTLDTARHDGVPTLPGRYFQGSLYALQRGLAALARADSATLTRAPSSAPDADIVEVRVPGVNLSPDGTIERLGRPMPLTYRLTIDHATGLPVAFERRSDNGDFMRTSFRIVEAHAPVPPASTWTYAPLVNASTRPEPHGNPQPLVEVGAEAPAWTLPVLDRASPMSLADLRGRPVLLVFWTAHCGYSIDAVPTVNALAQRHPRVAVWMLNVHDAAPTVRRFVRTNRVTPPVAFGAQEAFEAYGLTGFPSAVLVDARGRIAYRGDVADGALRDALARVSPR